MKRIDLIRIIYKKAKESGIHTVYFVESKKYTRCYIGSSSTSIGRHRQIRDIDLRSIMKDLEPELGAKWLEL